MNAEIHPIDVTTLKKGDVITVEQLEKITGWGRKSDAFKLRVLALRDRIMRELQDIGRPMVLRGWQGCSLRILTDPEATEYLDNQATSHLRGIGRSCFRLGQVDVRNLDEGQNREHERRILVHGKTLQCALAGRMDALKSIPHVSDRPALSGA